MLVVRAFDVLGGLCLQLQTHVTCCGSGTCPEPDEVAYETRGHDAYELDTVVPVVVDMLHGYLSAQGGAWLSGAVQNHLNSHLLY